MIRNIGILVVILNVMVNKVKMAEKALGGGTCEDLVENKSGQLADTPWTSFRTSIYSVIEQLVGHEINFYNVQFYNQTYTDYSSAEMIFSKSKQNAQADAYLSLCELNQMGHVPLDKIVWGTCSCDGCGSAWISEKICRGEDLGTMWLPKYSVYSSPEQLGTMFVEGGLTEQLGGVMSWKLDPSNKVNNALDFHRIIDIAKGKSAFFSDKTAPTRDIPRYVLYLNKWLNNVSDWDGYLKAASEKGVNYLILAFYRDVNGPVDTTQAWQGLGESGQLSLRRKYPNIKMLVSFGGDSVSTQNIPKNKDPKVLMEEIAEFGKKNHLDGVDFDLESFDSSFGEVVICLASYMTHHLKSVWPESIITHAPQSPHFGPLFEDITEEKRNKVLSMFDSNKYEGCYDHLKDGHRKSIPKPDSNKYRRPKYESEHILPLNYFDITKGKSTEVFTLTKSSQTNTSSQTTRTYTEASHTETEECIC